MGQAIPYAAYFDINWDAARPDLKGRVLFRCWATSTARSSKPARSSCASTPARAASASGITNTAFRYRRRPMRQSSPPAGRPSRRWPRHPRGLVRGEAARARARRQGSGLGRAGSLNCRGHGRAAGLFAGRPGEPASFRPLHRLLEKQAYRIAYWRVAADEINYRRFFNINDLAGLRMELPALFAATHGLIFERVGRGDVQGLRVDHIDGLYDPSAIWAHCGGVAAAGLCYRRKDTRPVRDCPPGRLGQYRLRPSQSGRGLLSMPGGDGDTWFYRRFSGDEDFECPLPPSSVSRGSTWRARSRARPRVPPSVHEPVAHP